MFRIEDDMTIHITRGDIATLEIKPTERETNAPYTMKAGDVVRLQVYAKKDHSNVVLKKDVIVSGDTTVVDMFLDMNDTKIGGIIDKPKEYWYEVELNPDTAPQTIIGYDDESGAKLFMLYPEGGDMNG